MAKREYVRKIDYIALDFTRSHLVYARPLVDFPSESMSFDELLATQKQKAASTAPADDFIDLDRDSSPEPDFAEMDQLLGRMRPSQSQSSSKPASQTRVVSKKPRSSVGNVAKSDSISSAKPVSKQKVMSSVRTKSLLMVFTLTTRSPSRARRIRTPPERTQRTRRQLP